MEADKIIKPEDYNEPRCILCDPNTGMPQSGSAVPLQRITEKLDEYCDRKDFAGAERHLEYWLSEAMLNNDLKGQFSLRNEMMGFFRKQGNREKAIENACAAVELINRLEMENTDSAATGYTNCGTVYDAFGMPDKAIEYFSRAKEIFERSEKTDGYKLGSLYNNLALALQDAERYEEAISYYEKAVDTMAAIENGKLEQAITYMNMTDSYVLWKGMEGSEDIIKDFLSKALELIEDPDIKRDGYYAFVLEKCAPGFYCYGFTEYADEIQKRSEDIYREISEG